MEGINQHQDPEEDEPVYIVSTKVGSLFNQTVLNSILGTNDAYIEKLIKQKVMPRLVQPPSIYDGEMYLHTINPPHLDGIVNGYYSYGNPEPLISLNFVTVAYFDITKEAEEIFKLPTKKIQEDQFKKLLEKNVYGSNFGNPKNTNFLDASQRIMIGRLWQPQIDAIVDKLTFQQL